MSQNKDRLLAPYQVAEMLGIGERTVRRLASEGQFYAFPVRGSIRISEKSVKGYEKRQRNLYKLENAILEEEIVTDRSDRPDWLDSDK